MIVAEHQVSESAVSQRLLSRAARSLNVLKPSLSRREVSSGAMSIDDSAAVLLNSVLDVVPTACAESEQEDEADEQNKLNIIVSDAN